MLHASDLIYKYVGNLQFAMKSKTDQQIEQIKNSNTFKFDSALYIGSRRLWYYIYTYIFSNKHVNVDINDGADGSIIWNFPKSVFMNLPVKFHQNSLLSDISYDSFT